MTIYAQGDILLIPTDGTPDPKTSLNGEGEPAILAHGEHSGMMHAFYGNATMFHDEGLASGPSSGGDLYMGHVTVGEGGAKLEHGPEQGAPGDHDTIDVPEGTYTVRGQREHRPERERAARVLD